TLILSVHDDRLILPQLVEALIPGMVLYFQGYLEFVHSVGQFLCSVGEFAYAPGNMIESFADPFEGGFDSFESFFRRHATTRSRARTPWHWSAPLSRTWCRRTLKEEQVTKFRVPHGIRVPCPSSSIRR